MFRRYAALPFLLAGFVPLAHAASLPGPLAALNVPALPAPIPAIGAGSLPAMPGLPALPAPGNGDDLVPPGPVSAEGVLEVQPLVLSDSTVALPGLEGTQTVHAVTQLDRKLSVSYRVNIDPALLAPSNNGGVDLKLPADVQLGVGGVLPQ